MSKMQDLFVSLVLNKHNLQILHWNCFGLDFDPTHEKLAEYIDQLDTYIDEVAETLKMCGESPLNFTECVEYAQASDVAYIVLPNTDYCTRAVWTNCKSIFSSLIDLCLSITDSDYPRDVVSKIDEFCYWFRLEGNYKGNSRLAEHSCEPEEVEDAETVAPSEEAPVSEEVPAPPSTPEAEEDAEKEVLHDYDADYDDDIDAPEPEEWDDEDEGIIPDDDM